MYCQRKESDLQMNVPEHQMDSIHQAKNKQHLRVSQVLRQACRGKQSAQLLSKILKRELQVHHHENNLLALIKEVFRHRHHSGRKLQQQHINPINSVRTTSIRMILAKVSCQPKTRPWLEITAVYT